MKSSLRGISIIALIAAAVAAGCGKSPTESFCAKGQECGLLDKNQTEAQCVANGEKAANSIHTDPGCSHVSEKYDGVLGCMSTLSCTELKDQSSLSTKCKQQVADLVAALLVDANTCKSLASMSGGGFGMISSGTAGQGNVSTSSGSDGAGGASGESSSSGDISSSGEGGDSSSSAEGGGM